MAGVSKKGIRGFQPVETGGVHTGTEAWNIAQYYTGYSIALPLKELNELEDIARFGTLRMDDDLIMTDSQIAKRRAEAVKRYWQKIKQVVNDTMFKVKKDDKKEAMEIKEYLENYIVKFLDSFLELKRDGVTHEEQIVVKENFMIKVLDNLIEKKSKYLFILDRTGLIFRESDEVDLDKMTSDFIHGG